MGQDIVLYLGAITLGALNFLMYFKRLFLLDTFLNYSNLCIFWLIILEIATKTP